jgi:hypothetical protein
LVEQLPHCDLLRLILLTERFVLSARQVFPYSRKDVFAFKHAPRHCSFSARGAGFFFHHVSRHCSVSAGGGSRSARNVAAWLPSCGAQRETNFFFPCAASLLSFVGRVTPKKPTTLRIPRRSPIQVLTQPKVA